MEQTLLLLRFNCPAPDCDHMATDWPALEKHTLSNHGLVICRVCRSQLSRFAHEQTLYPPHLLPLHDPSRLRHGQRPPKPKGEEEVAMVKSWDAPHPMCEVSASHSESVADVSSAISHSSDLMSCLPTCASRMKSVTSAKGPVSPMSSEWTTSACADRAASKITTSSTRTSGMFPLPNLVPC